MSLKAFHIFFIFVSLAVAYGFGVWSFCTAGADRALGLVSFAVGAALTVYLPWFLKKGSR